MSMEGDPLKALPKMAKGPLPDHLDCRDAELVLSLALASAAEISALYDRISVLERLIADKMSATPVELQEIFQDAGHREARAKWREGFVKRLLRGFEAALDEDGRAMSRADYENFMDKLAQGASK